MGMFDYINCDIPLPDGYTAKGFQTTKALIARWTSIV